MKTFFAQHSLCQLNWYGVKLFLVFVIMTGIHSANLSGQTAVPLTVNALPKSASISVRGENDIYSFTTGSSGGTFTMQTYGDQLNTYMYLYRLSGTTPINIAENNDSGNGTNAWISKALSANMTYYIRVKAYSTTAIGSYYINVVREPYYQPPRNLNGTAGNSSITLNWTAPWSNQTRPTSYNVYTSTSENGIYLRQGPTTSTSILLNVLPKSTHWYYVTAVYPTGESFPSNKVGVTAADAQVLTLDGVSVSASIGSLNEEDWYRFLVPYPANNPYHVGANGIDGEIDLLMYIYESDMTTLFSKDENVGPYWDASLSEVFGSNKWYYVKVKAKFLNSQSYTIGIKHNVTIYSVPLQVNAIPFKSTINPAGEYELYRFMTAADGIYTIQTYGSLDTKMILHDGQPSNPIAETDENDGEGYNALISRSFVANKWYYFYITAPSKGEYSVEVKGTSTPVTGSTVGNTQIFSSVSTTGSRKAQPVTMTESGTLNSVAIYHGAGTGNLMLAVYNTSGGLPSQRIAVTPSTPVTAAEGWQTVNLTTPVAVSQGSTIWLAWVFQNTVPTRYTSGTPGRAQSTALWSGGMPDVFGASTVSSNKYSIYANYTPGTPGAASINVTSPNGGENWQVGSIRNITWISTGTSGNVKIEYSTNNGSSWVNVIASTPDDGSHPWTIPNTLSTNCRVRVSDTDGSPTDQGNAVFTISTASASATVGNTQIFSSVSTTGSRKAQPVTMTESGTLNSVAIYHGAGTGNLMLAVYNTSGGLPSQRIAVTPSTPVTAAEGWQTVNLTTPVAVSQGSTIWLAWVFQNTVPTRYTSGTPGRAQSTALWSGGMPDVFGTSTTGSYKYSIYANYTPGSTKSTEDYSIQIDEPLNLKDNFEFSVYPTLVSNFLNIDVELPEAQRTIIRVYDVTGRVIAELWNAPLEKGKNRLYFDDLSAIKENSGSGMLIIQLLLDNKVETRKILMTDN